MASRRRRKRAAQAQGLTAAELELVELLEEVLEAWRWSQVLGYANQFLLNQHLQITAEERDRVMRAAADSVEDDTLLRGWQQRLAAVRARLAAMDASLRADGARRTEAADGA